MHVTNGILDRCASLSDWREGRMNAELSARPVVMKGIFMRGFIEYGRENYRTYRTTELNGIPDPPFKLTGHAQ